MRALGHWILTVFATPAGVLLLAALDSTTFFYLPLGIDAVVIIVAARLAAKAWIVPLLATAGSLAGAGLTFWIGAKIGDAGLDRYASAARLAKIRKRVRQSGAVALAILDLIPPPFPFTLFVLTAGALEVNALTFFATLTVCRLVRFGLETLLAVWYGGHIIVWLESDLFHDVVAIIIVAALAATAVSLVRLVRSTRPRRRAHA
jgi:membrane protein YqaA with SNARE-associated domain